MRDIVTGGEPDSKHFKSAEQPYISQTAEAGAQPRRAQWSSWAGTVKSMGITRLFKYLPT